MKPNRLHKSERLLKKSGPLCRNPIGLSLIHIWLTIANDGITFQARFGGVARDISIPISNVAAIYARENGAGMAFDPESEGAAVDPADTAEPSPNADHDGPPEPPTTPPAGRPKLQRIK